MEFALKLESNRNSRLRFSSPPLEPLIACIDREKPALTHFLISRPPSSLHSVIKIDRDERRIGLRINAANYSSEQLAAEVAAHDSMSEGDDLMKLGELLDEATRES